MARYDITFEEQDEFANGYAETMLWANAYRDGEDGCEPVDALHDGVELSEKAEAALWQDSLDFLTPQVVRLINGATRRTGYSLSQAGHDFALTRNGQGAGFWDRDLGLVGEALTKIARPCGERSLWIDADGIAHTE